MKYLIIILNRIRKKRIILIPNVMPVVRTLEEDFLDSPEKFGALISFYGVLLRKLKEEEPGIEILHHIATLDPDLYKMMRVEESPKINPSMAKYNIETLKRRALKAGTKPLNIFANEKKTRYKTRYREIIEFLERLYKYAIKTRRECRAEFYHSKISSLKRLKETKKVEEGRKEEEEKGVISFNESKETKSRVKEEDKIYLKRIISGKDIFMCIPEGKDITKPEASHYEILLIEDDLSHIRLMLRYFKLKGHTIMAVTTGHNIIEKVKRFQPKVILTDICHPGPTGLEICKQIKSTKEFKQIPIIFQSAQSFRETVQCAKEIGADGYIFKPFSYNDFERYLKYRGIFDLLNQ